MKKKAFSRLFTYTGSFFALCLGKINWTSPPWIDYLRRNVMKRPIIFWTTTISILVLLVAASYGYCWYKNRPKPQLITASIKAPKISSIENDELVFDSLTIDFGVKDPEGNFIPLYGTKI